jgi:FKBP-type peptidyl-prolyl cis-trans isomerase FkpA
MKHLFKAFIVIVAAIAVACGARNNESVDVAPTMQTSADSMSYVMGMNIGLNMLGIDSMLNVDVLCEGLRDAYRGEAKLNAEEARMAFLKYLNYDNYERIKAYESRFLEDLRKQDRKFVATHSGLTYKVTELGNPKKSARNNRDTLHIRYRILNPAGEVVDTTYYRADTLRLGFGSMVKGLQEATRLIGEGGHIEAWLPSQLAFGAEGCDTLNIKPNTMLYYEMWLVDVEER